MTCTLTLTIIALTSTFTVTRDYTGNLVRIEPDGYVIDFTSSKLPSLNILKVKKDFCEKAQ